MPPARNGQPRRRFPAEILSDAEVCQLLDACSRGPTGLRNRALIAILYRGGLRINEALDLFPKDIDLEHGSIRILNGKGGRARTIGVDLAGGHVIARWLEVRRQLGRGRRAPVLCTLGGGEEAFDDAGAGWA